MGFPDPSASVTYLLVVSDVERSRDWYRDVLGADVERGYGGTSCVLRLLGSWVVLVTGGGPTADKPTTTFEVPADPDRVAAQVILGVSDCQATYEELSSRGAHFLTPPVDYEWETRAFFRDPDGHLFEISQSRS